MITVIVLFIKKQIFVWVQVAHQNKDYSQGKTKKVAWFVSNCGTLNKREDYVKELSKYIDVDIYGS